MSNRHGGSVSLIVVMALVFIALLLFILFGPDIF